MRDIIDLTPHKLKNHFMQFLIVGLGALLLNCSNQNTEQSQQTDNENLATSNATVIASVDGLEIDKALFEAHKHNLNIIKPGQYNDDQILDQLIRFQLLAREARLKELDKTEEAEAHLALLKLKYLADSALKQFDLGHSVTTEQIREEYNQAYSQDKHMHYHLWQIVQQTQEAAEQIIQQLNEGKDFIHFSRTINPGKELVGWKKTSEIPINVLNTIQSLQDGEYSEPLEVDGHWIIYFLQNSRKLPLPDYEEIMPEIKQALRKEARKTHIKALRAEAEIEIKGQVDNAEASDLENQVEEEQIVNEEPEVSEDVEGSMKQETENAE